MVDMSNAYEINLTHGEVMVDVIFFDKKMVNRYGGQDVQYRYVVKFRDGAFDNVEVLATARIISDPFVELTFDSAEAFLDKDFILGSDEEDYNEDGLTNTTAGEMVEELVDKHEFLEALTEVFYRT